MDRYKIVKIIGVFLFICLIIIQFIRPEKNIGNSYSNEDITHVVAFEGEIKTIIENACFDCHSNNTQYPWYSNVMPVGWILNNHVTNGKKKLNFSLFSSYNISKQINKFEEIAEEISEGKMPPADYVMMHSEAQLTDEQKQLIINWANNAASVLEEKED